MGSLALETDVAIETPEHIVFRYRVAGPARRFFAYLLDLLLCVTALFVVVVVVLLALAAIATGIPSVGEAVAGAGVGLLFVAFFAAQWLYFVCFEAWRSQSPGKMVLGLRVVTLSGRAIGLREAVLRNLLRAADALPAAMAAQGVMTALMSGLVSVAALFSMILTRRFQRLGDLVAGTMVVLPERVVKGPVAYVSPPPEPFELAALPETVLFETEEREAVELFLRRRGRFGKAREAELALMVFGPLASRVGYNNPDPVRGLALLYHRASTLGRSESPPSSRGPASWR